MARVNLLSHFVENRQMEQPKHSRLQTESQQGIRISSGGLPVALIDFDERGVVCEINQFGAVLLGYETAAIVGRPFSLWLKERRCLDLFRNHIRDVMRWKERITTDLYLHTNAHATPRAVRFESVFVPAVQRSHGYCRSALVDITDVQEKMEGTRAEYARLKQWFDSAQLLMLMLDQQGVIRYCNNACAQLTHYSEAELVGETFCDLLFTREDASKVRSGLDRLASGLTRTAEQLASVLTKPGVLKRVMWFNVALQVELDASVSIACVGIEAQYWSLVRTDEHRQMLDLAHVSRLTAMGEMATEIAHELNQPLSSISNLCHATRNLLGKDALSRAHNLEILQDIAEQAERAGKIIRRLRGFSRKQDTQYISLNVNKLILDIKRLVNVEARWYRVNIELFLGENLPPVMGDKILMEQVILNLVRNAIDVVADHSGERKIAVYTKAVLEKQVEIMVRDSGPGIGGLSVEKIFEPFFTTKAQGMGLGLSISRSIIEAHGGRLWAVKNPERGLTLHCALPVAVRGGYE